MGDWERNILAVVADSLKASKDNVETNSQASNAMIMQASDDGIPGIIYEEYRHYFCLLSHFNTMDVQ